MCSNVATATVDSDAVSADQLRRLGDLAQQYDIKVAFEALAWGRFVDDYRRAWRIVQLADHPNVGLCLDSFHVLSRGHDPAAIEDIPAEKIFFLQLADAPALSMDVLSWSRHHRLFPGEGAFDLATFVSHVLATGYDGPLSLEVFNDTFRQTDPDRTAVHALRSLLWLQDKGRDRHPEGWRGDLIALTPAKPPIGFDFVEVKAEDTSEVEMLLQQLGFTPSGRHRTKPVSLWTAGDARVVLNEQQARDQVAACRRHRSAGAGRGGHLAARGRVDGTSGLSPQLCVRTSRWARRSRPDGTEMFWVTEACVGRRVRERATGRCRRRSHGIDHINVSQPWQTLDDAVLFFTSLFGLSADVPTEVPGPAGLMRSQSMRTRTRRCDCCSTSHRMCSMAPTCPSTWRSHAPTSSRWPVPPVRAGLHFLPVSDNYYDYLVGPVRLGHRSGDRAARAQPALRSRCSAANTCTSIPGRSAGCFSNSCSGATNTTATETTMRQCVWLPNAARDQLGAGADMTATYCGFGALTPAERPQARRNR